MEERGWDVALERNYMVNLTNHVSLLYIIFFVARIFILVSVDSRFSPFPPLFFIAIILSCIS